MWIINIITTVTTLTCFNTKRIRYSFITINIKNFRSYNIVNYNIEIDGRNFYDQPINDSVKQYDEVKKISTAKGDDYTTGCLLDFDYFEKKK